MKVVSGRRGNATTTALSLIPLLGFGALSVDVGLQRMVSVQLQAAVDAAALGGATWLDGSEAGLTAAVDHAVAIAAANRVYGGWQLDPEDVVLGTWVDDAFVPADADTPAADIDAIRVDADTSFGAILAPAAFGVHLLDTRAHAIALRKKGGIASEVACFLPFALPDCNFTSMPDGPTPRVAFVMNTTYDTIGWALPGGVSGNLLRDQVGDSCASGAIKIGDRLEVSGGRADTATHDILEMINGQLAGATMPEGEIADTLAWAPMMGGPEANPLTTTDILPERWGWTYSGPIPMIDMGPDCDAVDFKAKGDAEVTGFTYAYVYDVNSNGTGDKDLWFQFDFVTPYELGTKSRSDALGNIVGTLPAVLVP